MVKLFSPQVEVQGRVAIEGEQEVSNFQEIMKQPKLVIQVYPLGGDTQEATKELV